MQVSWLEVSTQFVRPPAGSGTSPLARDQVPKMRKRCGPNWVPGRHILWMDSFHVKLNMVFVVFMVQKSWDVFKLVKLWERNYQPQPVLFGFFHQQYVWIKLVNAESYGVCLVLVNLEGGFWLSFHVFFVGILSTRIVLSQATAPFLTEDVLKNLSLCFLQQGLNFDVVGMWLEDAVILHRKG